MAAQQWITGLRVPDWLVLLVAAVVTVTVAVWRWRRAVVAEPRSPGDMPEGDEEGG
jgi:hypothetical protein